MGYPETVMKRSILSLLIVLTGLSPLFAGGAQDAASPSEGGQEISIVDSLGREVTLPGLPERIVQAGAFTFMINDALYLFPSADEKLVTMVDGSQGRGSFLAAVDPGFTSKKLINRSVNIEEIMAADPDLVVMKNFHIKKFGEMFDEMNIPVVYLDLETPEAWEKDLVTLGQIYGNSERQQELTAALKGYRTEVEEAMTRSEGGGEEGRPDPLLLGKGGRRRLQPPSPGIHSDRHVRDGRAGIPSGRTRRWGPAGPRWDSSRSPPGIRSRSS